MTVPADDLPDCQPVPLSLTTEQMLAMGTSVVEFIVEHLGKRPWPSANSACRSSMPDFDRFLSPTAPEQGVPFEKLLAPLEALIVSGASNRADPRYLGYVPCTPTWLSVLGEFLASAFNNNVSYGAISPGPVAMEAAVISWFAQWLGMPADTAGLLVSGGSAANLAAIVTASEHSGGNRGAQVVYVSDQVHSSVPRALRVLGFDQSQVRVLATDRSLRMSPYNLERTMVADMAAGQLPTLVIATAGTTNNGVVDPLGEIAAVTTKRGAWLHVDAAYGGFAVLTERGKVALRGIEQADSVTLDPHKWLHQPFECGAVLVRDAGHLDKAFRAKPDYLESITSAPGERSDPAHQGLQLSRADRATKIWLSVSYFGAGEFRRAIDGCLDLAEFAEQEIRRNPALELSGPRELSTLCFTRKLPEAISDSAAMAAVQFLATAALERGQCFVSATRVNERPALRMCLTNPGTRRSQIVELLDTIASCELPAEIVGQAVPPTAGTESAIPWLDTLTPDLRASCEVAEFDPGDTIIAINSENRFVHVILDGKVVVKLPEGKDRYMGVGEFFGEISAFKVLEDYRLRSTADVIASTVVKTLKMDRDTLDDLRRKIPAIDNEVRTMIAERTWRTESPDDGFEARWAETDADYDALAKFRYEVYVADQQFAPDGTDHAAQRVEELDRRAKSAMVLSDGRLMASGRIEWGADYGDSFAPYMVELYGLQDVRGVLSSDEIMVLNRVMVHPDARGSGIVSRVFREIFLFAAEHGIQVTLLDCQPHLVGFYEKLGFRTILSTGHDPVIGGVVVPMAGITGDVLGSETLRHYQLPWTPADPSKPERLRQLFEVELVGDQTVRSFAAGFESDSELASLTTASLMPKDGDALTALSDQDLRWLLRFGHVLDVDPGQILISSGHRAKSIFLLLSGTCDVFINDTLIRRAEAGEVLGEVAFLLGSPRSATVVVSSPAKVISLMPPTSVAETLENPLLVAALYRKLAVGLAQRLITLTPESRESTTTLAPGAGGATSDLRAATSPVD